jgi:hypothetical protein
LDLFLDIFLYRGVKKTVKDVVGHFGQFSRERKWEEIRRFYREKFSFFFRREKKAEGRKIKNWA